MVVNNIKHQIPIVFHGDSFLQIQNQLITQYTALMQLREQDDFLRDVSNEEICNFLRIHTFGDMETDGSQLSTQEQQHLFDLLDRLHKTSGVDVKGIWPILSLSFKNRSGLVLMTMLYNSKVEFNELLSKKTFLKDIQTLENRNFTKKNLYRILEITGIEKQIFLQKFNKQRVTFQKIQQQQSHRGPQLFLGDNKIFQENQFDSDPEYQFYQEIKELQNDMSIHRNFSVMLTRNIFEDWTISESEEQPEETISLPFKRRSDREQRNRKMNKAKRKKSKRPNHKRKKQRMIHHTKKQDVQAINFISARREKRKLKQAYKLLNMEIDQNPTTAKKRQNNAHLSSPNRNASYSEDEQQNINHENQSQSQVRQSQVRQNQMRIRNRRLRRPREVQDQIEIEDEQSVEYFFIENNDIQEPQMMPEDQQEDRKLYKRLSKNQNQVHENSEKQLQNYAIYNESIQNLQVKYINFSVNSILENRMNPQMQQELEFNSKQYMNFVQAFTNTQKQTQNFIKQVVKDKNQTSFEDVEKIMKIMKTDAFQKYRQSYIMPILQYKLIKMLAKIIGDIVSILYTSSSSSMNAHHKSCRALIEIYKKSHLKQSEISLYIDEAIKTICEDFQEIRGQTESKIQLKRPVQIIEQSLKIRLNKEDFEETSLIALLILYNGFLANLFPPGFINKSEDNPVQKILRQRVKKNPKLIIHISQFYGLFKVQVTSKEELYSILSLTKQIDLRNNDHGIIFLMSEFISEIIQSFIEFRLKENTSFKAILSYVVRNQYLDSCQKIGEVGYEITLRKYEALLKFQVFHEDLTISKFLQFISKIDFTKNHEQSLFIGILDLLIKCYEIKFSANQPGVVNQQKSKENKKMIKLNLEKIIQIFCQKYQRYEQLEIFPNKQFEIGNLKKSKFSKIISTFYDKFIQSQKLSQNTDHLHYSFTILLTYIWPMLSKSTKQDSFTTSLTETLLKKIYQIQSFCANFQAQAHQKASQTQMMDEQEQMDFLFQLKQETNKKIVDFLNAIVNLFKELNIGQKVSKQFLSFIHMKKYKQNVCFQIHGVMSALSFFNNTGLNSLKLGIFRQLGEHAKEIKLEKSFRPFKTTNKFILEYLKGFFKTIKMFCHGNIMKIFEELGKDIRENILDILLISLVCEKDTKLVIQLIQMCYKIPGFNKNQHLLIYFPIHKYGAVLGKAKTDLQYYLYSVSQNKTKINNNLMFKVIQKFNYPIFNVTNKLYKQYDELEWKHMEAHIGLNLLNIFVFLFNVNANQNLIKMYRPSFVINDISLMNSKNNILLGLQLEEFSQFSSQQKLIEFFRIVYENNKNSLSRTMNQFFKYISNEQAKPEKFRNDREKFVKIKLLIEAIHNDKIDNTSIQICTVLLSNFLAQVFLREEVQDSALDFFFNLFKKYPNLKTAYMQIFKINVQKIDRIIKSTKNYNTMKCGSVEQAIKKYIINQYCLYEQLFLVLEKRVENHLRFDKFDEQLELNQVIEKCLTNLEKLAREDDRDIVGKFRNLCSRLRQKKNLIRLGNYNAVQQFSVQ